VFIRVHPWLKIQTPIAPIVHPDVFVQFFPAQGQPVQSERDLLEKILWRVGEQRIFGGGKTQWLSVGEFQTNVAVFHPPARGGGVVFDSVFIRFISPSDRASRQAG